MPYQTVNGIQIYYEERGKGEPLLLINGLSFSLDLWLAQIEELSRDFRVIALDNRGVGQSDKPDEEYTISLMASDAVKLLQTLDIRKAHIGGLSMGGYIAQEIALTYPEMVNRLVLMATSMGGEKALKLGMPFWEKAAAALQGLPPAQMYRVDLALMTAPGFCEKNQDKLEWASSCRLKNPQPMHGFLRQFAAASMFDINDRAHKITHPALVIMGREDPIFPISLADDYLEKLPDVKLIVYENCGHALLLEKAAQLSCDIREFLQD